jgi:hypothetical protein
MRSTSKGTIMKTRKFIAKAVVIAALASSAVAATAANTGFPSAGRDGYNQADIFPNVQTYKRQHRDSVLTQPSVANPSSAQQEYPLSGEFPNMQTYRQIHKNDAVSQSTTPTFPYSVPAETSMADEGLVPGVAGVAPYVATPGDLGVGATR